MKAATTKRIAAASSARGRDAVEDACREAVEALPSEPGLLLAFSSGERDFERDAIGIAEAAAGAPNAGMTGKGVFGPDGLVDDGCAAMAFSTGVSASVAAREDAASDLREAGRASDAEALERLERDAEVVLLFIDSTRGDIADTLSGAYEAAGPSVPLAGGAAGGSAKAHFHSGRASLSTHGEVARIRGAKGDRNHAVVTVAFG